ncbi:MAG: transporter substrate-binding domain-containing protein, partial [Desulfobulbus sp.]|nr:transporter substrate-binding domain-containing protein [Desulfobulbus sp.]
MTRLCLLLLLLFAPWPASGGSALPDDRPLRVVMDNTYPPYVFLDDRGTPQGILPDLWRLWQERTGVRVEITALDWQDALAAMRAGRHDVLDTAFRTEERDQWLEFGRPYARIEVAAFFDNEIGGLTDIDSLRGFAVAAKEGDAVIGHLRSRGVDNLLLFKGYEAIVEAARDNKVNVLVIDKPPALHYLHKYGLHRRFNASLPFTGGNFHRAVARGQTDLLAGIEAGFAAIPAAEMAAIDQKWRGIPLLDRLPLRLLLTAGGGACALILALFLWNRTLRRAVHHRTAELEQSREVLRQSEARYRELVEDANSIILRMDSTGRITFINEFAQRFFGYRAEEVLGENVVGTIVPERD